MQMVLEKHKEATRLPGRGNLMVYGAGTLTSTTSSSIPVFSAKSARSY